MAGKDSSILKQTADIILLYSEILQCIKDRDFAFSITAFKGTEGHLYLIASILKYAMSHAASILVRMVITVIGNLEDLRGHLVLSSF